MSEFIIDRQYDIANGTFSTVKRGEIVRCRDCACWFKGYCGRHSYAVSNEYGDTYTEGLFPMDGDDFCSLGERMEGSE